MPKKIRHVNHGVRKVCGCPHAKWAKCTHPWHFAFKWQGIHHRFSLDRHAPQHIDSKTEALKLADEIRTEIRAGTFGRLAPRAEMTLQHLVDAYIERYVDVERAATKADYLSKLGGVCRTELPHPTGGSLRLGDWRLSDIITDTIERFREQQRTAGVGVVGANRKLAAARAVFNWGIRLGYCESTPFKRHTETVVKLSPELPRCRRLQDGEEGRLLKCADPHLHALIVAALETGMRKGELLSLQWSQVEGLQIGRKARGAPVLTWGPKPVIFLPAGKTKTKRDRRVPITARLRAVLEMRRLDPAGQLLPLDAYVFGTAIGSRVANITHAWHATVLRAHGLRRSYTNTGNFTPKARAALKTIDLHFHDLRREAGSRWMDAGVPIGTVQRWLGHTNVSQTSTYLAGTAASEYAAMERFEAHRAGLQDFATKGGKRGVQQPPSAMLTDRKVRKTAIRHNTPIN